MIGTNSKITSAVGEARERQIGEIIVIDQCKHAVQYNRFSQFHVLCFVFLSMLSSFIFTSCNANTPKKSSTNVMPQSTTLSSIASTPQVTRTHTVSTYPVKIYFSKSPESYSNFNKVFPVDRVSPTSSVATFAVQQLIAGPTPSESSSGYFSELHKIMSGPSVCSNAASMGNADFTLTLDKKGLADEQGTATLKFCRTLSSPGVGADARIQSEIDTTLKQFANIKKVVLLTKDGHCFGNESGRDLCLR